MEKNEPISAAQDFAQRVTNKAYGTILADPPWQFSNRTGKIAPEHKRLNRYSTLTLNDIKEIPVQLVTAENSHLYLWVPNALFAGNCVLFPQVEHKSTMEAWGFTYKTNIVWHKIRKGLKAIREIEKLHKPGHRKGPADTYRTPQAERGGANPGTVST